jgi:hypothetical protein
VTATELARYPEPLAPGTAARRAGLAPVHPHEVAEAAQKLATEHDLVLVEGAGGLLVRFDAEGGTLADAARLLDAPVLVVASAGLGTLNTTELTARELRSQGLDLLGGDRQLARLTSPDLALGALQPAAPSSARTGCGSPGREAPLLGARSRRVPAGDGQPAAAFPRLRGVSAPGRAVGWRPR